MAEMLAAGWDGPTIYAAAVGTAGLLAAIGVPFFEHRWQERRWKAERQEEAAMKLTVTVGLAFGGILGAQPGVALLVVPARNDSRHNVRVSQVELAVMSDDQPSSWQWGLIWPTGLPTVVPPNTVEIPGPLGPHDEGHATYVWADSDREYFPHVRELKARVKTPDGVFESEPVAADDLRIMAPVRSLPFPEHVRWQL